MDLGVAAGVHLREVVEPDIESLAGETQRLALAAAVAYPAFRMTSGSSRWRCDSITGRAAGAEGTRERPGRSREEPGED